MIIAGILAPPVKSLFETDPAVLQAIRDANPDILLVAFGNPKQEKWINMHARELRVPVMIGVGATLDFIAGVVKRAPIWMQKSGLEWLFRLVQEPRRLWKRYMIDMTGFAVFFSRQWWAMRPSSGPSPMLPLTEIVVVDNTATIRVQGRLDMQNVAAFRTKAQEALDVTSHIVIDLSQADFLDSTGIGALVHLAKQARDAGGDVVLSAPQKSVMNVLSLLRMDRFFEIRTTASATTMATTVKTTPVQATTTMTAETSTVTSPASPAVMTPATASIIQPNDWDVLKMPRQLDNTTTPVMLAQCQQALTAHHRIVCDFTATVFVSSTGLAALVQLRRHAQGLGGDVRTAGCQGDVLRTMQLARFDKILAMYADVAAATA